MAFWTSIGAGQWSGLAVHTAGTIGDPLTITTEAAFKAGFATTDTDFAVMPNVREFPDVGTPANLVNVPQYGQSVTSQVQAQADAVSLEFVFNYVPSVWEPSATIGALVGDGSPYVFQYVVCSAEPPNFEATTTGLGTVPNAIWYFSGKLESQLFSNSLSDATTMRLAVSLPTGTVYGPFTQNAV